MGGLIDMEPRGCESIIHDHDRDPMCNHDGVGGMYRIVTGVTKDVGVPLTLWIWYMGKSCNMVSFQLNTSLHEQQLYSRVEL